MILAESVQSELGSIWLIQAGQLVVLVVILLVLLAGRRSK